MDNELVIQELRLAEQAIARQCLDDKNQKIGELERKIELLETMLNRVSAQRFHLPQPAPLPSIRTAPKRWSVR